MAVNRRIYLRDLNIEEDETFQEHLNQYDVIFLNMQQFLIESAPGKVTEYLEKEVLEELTTAQERITGL